MKRILVIFLAVFSVFFISSCSIPDNTESKTARSEVTVNMPEDDTVNGYRDKDFEKNTVIPVESITVVNSKDAKFCGNTSTKKFHTINCSVLKKTQKQNKYYAMDRDTFILMGYTPCKKCNP